MASDERENHKYYTRIPIKGGGKSKKKFRYFYTKKEYLAYLNNKKAKEEEETKKKNSILNAFKKKVASATKSASKTIKSVDKKIDKFTDKAKDAVVDKAKEVDKKIDKFSDDIKDNVEDVVKEVDKKIDKVENKLSEVTKTLDKKIEKGKAVADKFIQKNGNKSVGSIVVAPLVAKIASTAVGVLAQIGVGVLLAQGIIALKDKFSEYKAKKNKETLPKKTKEWTKEADMKVINPDYDPTDWSTSYNCTYCTAAYDLRQRGYDVEAMHISRFDDSTTSAEIMSWYKGADMQTLTDITSRQWEEKDGYNLTNEQVYEYIEDDLKQHGEGARGHMIYYWQGGGAHDVVWEITNGEVVIRDCQNNKVLSVADYGDYASDIEYFRSDNLELNDEIFRTVRARRKEK